MEMIAVDRGRSRLVLKAVEVLALMLTASLFVLKAVVCLVTWWGNPSLLLIDVSLPEALEDEAYKLTIALPNWVHLMWPFLFFWEAVLIIFACAESVNIVQSLLASTQSTGLPVS